VTRSPLARDRLISAIESALNEQSAENESDTPDFILAEHMVRALESFEIASRLREDWYGHRHAPGGTGLSGKNITPAERMPAMDKSPGQVAYEAYLAKSDGRSLVSGAELPDWGLVPGDIRDAWEAAASAVLADDAERRKGENKPA
jgi:hypothetical protein